MPAQRVIEALNVAEANHPGLGLRTEAAAGEQLALEGREEAVDPTLMFLYPSSVSCAFYDASKTAAEMGVDLAGNEPFEAADDLAFR